MTEKPTLTTSVCCIFASIVVFAGSCFTAPYALSPWAVSVFLWLAVPTYCCLVFYAVREVARTNELPVPRWSDALILAGIGYVIWRDIAS